MRSVLFDLHHPFFLSGYLPVMSELAARGVEVAVSTMTSRAFPSVCDSVSREVHAARIVPVGDVGKQRWDLVVVGSSLAGAPYQARQKVAMFNHGGCSGGNLPSSYVLNCFKHYGMDHYMALGQSDLDYGERTYRDIWRGKEVGVGGWPKLDRVQRNDDYRNRFLTNLGLDPALRTLVLFSHWTELGLLRTIGLSLIGELIRRSDCNIIVSAHPHIFALSKEVVGVDYGAALKTLSVGKAMKVWDEWDSTPLLSVADIVVSDFSSVSCEACAFGLPIIRFLHPNHVYSDARLAELLERGTYTVTTTQGTLGAIDSLLTGTHDREKESYEVGEYVYANVGCAAKPVADLLETWAVGSSS